MSVKESLDDYNKPLILSNLWRIKVYSKVSGRYYTDGRDVYVEVKKERGSKYHRIKIKGSRKYIKSERDCPKNYLLLNGRLFKKLKWQFDKNGYLFLMVDVKTNPAKISQHRLVYFYQNNIIPNDGLVIDHINRCKNDNRIENLRLVSCKENSNNADLELASKRHSKYNYVATNILSGEIVNGYAKDISKRLGLQNSLVNRYAKNGYLFNKTWRIKASEVF